MKIYRPGALRSVLVAVGVGVLLVYTTGVFARQRCGMRVDIRNASAETLTQVRVRVGGIGDRWKNYRVADIRAGGRARIYVQPVTESGISLEFTDAKGVTHADSLMGYVEAGYSGGAVSTISSEKRIHSASDLGCWKSWLDFI